MDTNGPHMRPVVFRALLSRGTQGGQSIRHNTRGSHDAGRTPKKIATARS